MKKIIGLGLIVLPLCLFAQTTNYAVTQQFQIKSNGGWDYLSVYENKLFVSHGGNTTQKYPSAPFGINPHFKMTDLYSISNSYANLGNTNL